MFNNSLIDSKRILESLWDELVNKGEDPVIFNFEIAADLSSMIKKRDKLKEKFRILKDKLVQNSQTLRYDLTEIIIENSPTMTEYSKN